MSDYFVQEEDGTSHIDLEESTDSLILEEAVELEARISQVPVEVVLSGDSEARISQVPVEFVLSGDSEARISQAFVEVLVTVSHENVQVVWIP